MILVGRPVSSPFPGGPPPLDCSYDRAEQVAANTQAYEGKDINSGRGPREEANLDIVQISENGGGGNSADYLTRRLVRDHPDIAERMRNGEYRSVRAAAPAAANHGRPRKGGATAFSTHEKRGSTEDYVARLKRDDPDMAEQVINGELTASSAISPASTWSANSAA